MKGRRAGVGSSCANPFSVRAVRSRARAWSPSFARMPIVQRTVALCLFVALAGLGCSDPDPSACESSADCAPGAACRDGMCVAGGPDGGRADSGALECGPCASGLCDGELCCAVESACGDVCCGAREVCFADACVLPGDACADDGDCAEGAYCEPALGEGGEVCGAPRGRCLSLPPICGPGVGEPCINAGCEYRPEAGPLDAVAAWRWGPGTAVTRPDAVDVWSTPVVGRLQDDNCDGKVDARDTPNVVFVSGDTHGSLCGGAGVEDSCQTGVLRVLDGATGEEVWSLERPAPDSIGFAGMSVALGDVMGDEKMEIVAFSGEGRLVIVSNEGAVLATSDDAHPLATARLFGWGGGIALADIEGDGNVEAAFGATVWSISRAGVITRRFSGSGGVGTYWVGSASALSYFANVDLDSALELIAGTTVYEPDGSVRWTREADFPDGFTGIADLDGDGAAELVVVTKDVDNGEDPGYVVVLDASSGATVMGPLPLPSVSVDGGPAKNGGPPTIADFDGDGRPEIGVAQQNRYYMIDVVGSSLEIAWGAANKDQSSAVTGSTVFDFEGDGRAEVVYNDECFLYVYDGVTGAIRFSAPTSSFTATEASIVADVDGDGHADMVMISNGAGEGYECDVPPWNAADGSRAAWTPPSSGTAYRGITVWRDRARSWVGTRAIWNQHSYHVTNVCASGDSACPEGSHEGQIPARPLAPWSVDWLNAFRQNIAEEGIFAAPDAVVSLRVECTATPRLVATLRNVGAGRLAAGVVIRFEHGEGAAATTIGTVTSPAALSPGQAVELPFALPTTLEATDAFRAVIEPDARTFRECDVDNDSSEVVRGSCLI